MAPPTLAQVCSVGQSAAYLCLYCKLLLTVLRRDCFVPRNDAWRGGAWVFQVFHAACYILPKSIIHI